MRHDERPGRQRHELPGEQEGEGVVGQHDQVHPGEEGRQRTAARAPARSRADRSRGRRAGARAAEIDDDEKERGERVEAEVSADPGDAERQGDRVGGARSTDQAGKRNDQDGDRGGEAQPVDRQPRFIATGEHNANHGSGKQHGDRDKHQPRRHAITAPTRRTDAEAAANPRPCPPKLAPSSSCPKPRVTPSAARRDPRPD